MTSGKIKFKVEVWDKTLVFQVLYMDERFRGAWEFYTAPNGFVIGSFDGPCVGDNQANLWGRHKVFDRDVCIFNNFKTPEDAANNRRLLIEAIADWAKNWPGWNESDCPIESYDDGVYEF